MQNILNKLAKIQKAQPQRSKFTKAKPNRVAVKLSVIDDINSELDSFDDAYSEASYMAYEWGEELLDKISDFRDELSAVDDWAINGNARMLEEIAGNILTNLEILEEKAGDLGIDPNELYPDFDDLKERVESAGELSTDTEKKYKEVVEFSGFLNNFW